MILYDCRISIKIFRKFLGILVPINFKSNGFTAQNEKNRTTTFADLKDLFKSHNLKVFVNDCCKKKKS
jgi:hypothetical protein